MINVLIVDDQNLIRETIQVYLEQEADLEVVGHAENGTKALKQIEKLTPDVVVLDLEMPDMDGLSTIKAIRDRFSQIEILVLSSHDDRSRLNQAIEAGAKGYLTKGTPLQQLANVVRSINQGYFQLGPGLMEKLVISLSHDKEQTSKNIEQKLIVALKKFKQDTNQQLPTLVKAELQESYERLERQFELKIYGFKKKHNDLYGYLRKVEFRLYLLLLLQVLFIFGLAIVWLLDL